VCVIVLTISIEQGIWAAGMFQTIVEASGFQRPSTERLVMAGIIIRTTLEDICMHGLWIVVTYKMEILKVATHVL
jgi:hypothetical protein